MTTFAQSLADTSNAAFVMLGTSSQQISNNFKLRIYAAAVHIHAAKIGYVKNLLSDSCTATQARDCLNQLGSAFEAAITDSFVAAWVGRA